MPVGTSFHQGPAFPLDHATPTPLTGHSIGIDATAKLAGEHPGPWPVRLVADEATKKLVAEHGWNTDRDRIDVTTAVWFSRPRREASVTRRHLLTQGTRRRAPRLPHHFQHLRIVAEPNDSAPIVVGCGWGLGAVAVWRSHKSDPSEVGCRTAA